MKSARTLARATETFPLIYNSLDILIQQGLYPIEIGMEFLAEIVQIHCISMKTRSLNHPTLGRRKRIGLIALQSVSVRCENYIRTDPSVATTLTRLTCQFGNFGQGFFLISLEQTSCSLSCAKLTGIRTGQSIQTIWYVTETVY